MDNRYEIVCDCMTLLKKSGHDGDHVLDLETDFIRLKLALLRSETPADLSPQPSVDHFLDLLNQMKTSQKHELKRQACNRLSTQIKRVVSTLAASGLV